MANNKFEKLFKKLINAKDSGEVEDIFYEYQYMCQEEEESPEMEKAIENINKFAALCVGEKLNEVRKTFYEELPECMFLGGADQAFSLKLRCPEIMECIPDDELSRFGTGEHFLDGYSNLEGWALVKDKPLKSDARPPRYPAEIKKIIDRLKERKLKLFPNIIFPLTQGDDVMDTCDQMLDLLKLLDHGYHFQSMSEYMSEHPEFFPKQTKKRWDMLKKSLETEEDDELFADEYDELLADEDWEEGDEEDIFADDDDEVYESNEGDTAPEDAPSEKQSTEDMPNNNTR